MHEKLKQIKFDDYIKAQGWTKIPFTLRWLTCLNPNTTDRKSFTVEHATRGLTLKLNRHEKTLRIRRCINGKDQTPVEVCSWRHDEPAPFDVIESLLTKFAALEASLPHFPTTAALHYETPSLSTIKDALLIYQKKSESEYGESGDTPKKIERLLRLHLNQPQTINVKEGGIYVERLVTLSNVQIRELTAHQFNLYLKAFDGKRGVRDEIVKFVKAAANHCKSVGLLKSQELYDWSKVHKTKVERHVSILDLDLSTILRALGNINHQDFKVYMYIAVHGHLRKGLTTALEHEWFDHQHSTLTIPAHLYKNRQAMVFNLSPEMMSVVKRIRDEQNPSTKYLFPSQLSNSGHRTNFDYQWYKLMEILGLYEDIVNEKGETTRVYKYRQHDFRDTLIDRLLDLGVDELVMAGLLGQVSTSSVASYKKAKERHTKGAASQNNQVLVNKFTGMQHLQNDLTGTMLRNRDLHDESKNLSYIPRNQTGTKSVSMR